MLSKSFQRAPNLPAWMSRVQENRPAGSNTFEGGKSTSTRKMPNSTSETTSIANKTAQDFKNSEFAPRPYRPRPTVGVRLKSGHGKVNAQPQIEVSPSISDIAGQRNARIPSPISLSPPERGPMPGTSIRPSQTTRASSAKSIRLHSPRPTARRAATEGEGRHFA